VTILSQQTKVAIGLSRYFQSVCKFLEEFLSSEVSKERRGEERRGGEEKRGEGSG
jgi:hypothetical protein